MSASISVWDALGLALAQEVKTDREYPPFNRSTRDGYAVLSREIRPGVQLKCAGEIKAGDTVTLPLRPGTCVQIMTGAAVPAGADAVIMIEYTQREGDLVRFERAAQPGQNIVPRGSEARARRWRRESPAGTGIVAASGGEKAQSSALDRRCRRHRAFKAAQ